jgi:hypothetical protein
VLVDPLGRRFGFVAGEGEINEIPGALFSGDGDVEQFFIPNPIPGNYEIELCGVGDHVNAGFGGTLDGYLYQGFLDDGETDTVILMVPVVAISFDVLRGIQLGGDLADTKAADDLYLKFNSGFKVNSGEPQVWIEFESHLPSDSPAFLGVTLEGHASTVGLTQTIEMFNWNTGQYQQVDSVAASWNNDSIVTVDLTGNIPDYVQAESGAVKTRMGWKQTGIVLSYPWTINIDQVAWSITN